MTAAKKLVLALAILPLHDTQAHNWLQIEKKPRSIDIKKQTQDEAMIVITDALSETISVRFVAVKDETYIVHLINETGNEVSRQYRFLEEGQNSIEIRTSKIPEGNYHIKIENEYQSEIGKLEVHK
jgi:hypothetical protein